jgi:hypothetical protein
MSESVHISEHINRNVAEVYLYASNIENLTAWAAGVSPDMQIRFAKNNYFGVLDHWATVNGQTFYNPMRVIEDGPGRSEVVFTLRDATDDDRAAIAADLATLKRILEAPAG